MSLNNGQLHGFAFAGTLVLAGSLFGTTLYLTEAAGATQEPQLKEMVTIEALLARKSEKKQQPQKEQKAPEPEVKPEGVSHDEHKKPLEKKPEEPKKRPKKPDDKPIDLSKFKHASDDDPQPGAKPITDTGQFNGSDRGFAPINAGHPYWQNLNADFRQGWEIPTISKVNGTVEGCVHIEPDGKIVSVKLETRSGDQILDDSVERTMKATQKARNDRPQPVPTEELVHIRKMVCFRFNPNQ